MASNPSPTASLLGKAQRAAPALWQHLLPQHPTPPAGSGVLRVLPPEGLGQHFASVLSHAVIWGTHAPKKKKNGTRSGCQNREAVTASLGLDTALVMCQGGEGNSITDSGGSTLGSLQQCLCCFLLEAGDEVEEREGVAQRWGGSWQGPCHGTQRRGRSALETSCLVGCLPGHQLGSWGEEPAAGPSMPVLAFSQRQRCLGPCSCRWKALEFVQQLPSKLLSPETASVAA